MQEPCQAIKGCKSGLFTLHLTNYVTLPRRNRPPAAAADGKRQTLPDVSGQPISCPVCSARMRYGLCWAPISAITVSTSPGLMWVM